MGDNYEISVPKAHIPKVKIYGFSERYTKEELIENLKAQNERLATDKALIQVVLVSVRPNSKGRYFGIVETDGSSYRTLLQNEVMNIGWDRCRVFDAVSISRCFKCLGSMHKASQCKNKKTCGKCGDKHDASKCT